MHVHVLSSLYPTLALAELVKDIKVASSIWIKENHVFAQLLKAGRKDMAPSRVP